MKFASEGLVCCYNKGAWLVKLGPTSKMRQIFFGSFLKNTNPFVYKHIEINHSIQSYLNILYHACKS